MDEFFGIIILIIIFSVLERALKGAKAKGQPGAPAEGEEAAGSERPLGLPSKLEEMIAEELGINLERRPRIEAPESAEATPGPPTLPAAAQAAPPSGTRAVVHPSAPRLPEAERSSLERGAEAARARRAATLRRRTEPVRAPLSVDQAMPGEQGTPFSREEWGTRERGRPVSLEEPRRAEDHERFHERYQVPQPVASHDEFQTRYVDRQRRRARRLAPAALPDEPGWSDVKRAIIWAEVLGPPKGLE
ncbi:MAG: hypothetical protein JSU87_15825 [Gemmatimonadota bacterium]|nr:MAG: hypothetical protein JSU87_15825 [Gemmatimonadota bacterium]